jgi:putative tricarboxylic transport membrane protein
VRRAHQIAGAAFLALALFLGWHATRLPYYSALGPGPGFFPVWLCGILAVLAVIVLAGAIRTGDREAIRRFWPEREALVPITGVIAGLAFVVLAMRPLGYVATMLAFYLVLVVMLGSRRPLTIAAVAALGSFGMYFVFARYLKQALPAGTLWM